MAPRCTVCTHQKKHEIDELVVDGSRSYRDIARQYGLDYMAIFRHMQNHLGSDLVKAKNERDVLNVVPIIDNIENAQTLAQAMIAASIQNGKVLPFVASKTITQLLKLAEIQLKIQEAAYLEATGAGQLDIFTHPDILALMRIVREELAPYPDVVMRINARIYSLRTNKQLPEGGDN